MILTVAVIAFFVAACGEVAEVEPHDEVVAEAVHPEPPEEAIVEIAAPQVEEPYALEYEGTPQEEESDIVQYEIATLSTRSVLVNGQTTALYVYEVGGESFVGLMDLAGVLNGTQVQFYVSWWEQQDVFSLSLHWFGWRGSLGSIDIPPPSMATAEAIPATATVRLVNAELTDLRGHYINGDNYFMLSQLSHYLGFDVEWGEAAILIDTGEPYVSDFGWQVVEDFLVDFLSIFSFGWGPDSDALVWYYHIPYFAYRDHAGNIIENAVFIDKMGSAIASRFALFDLDDSGIPHISVWFGMPESCGGHSVLYRFIDGEFLPIHTARPSPNFFFTEHGRLIMHFETVLDGKSGYYYAHFDGEIMALESAIDKDDINWCDWFYFHNNSVEFLTSPTIFNTDIPLTRIHPMIALQNEITANIRERLELN